MNHCYCLMWSGAKLLPVAWKTLPVSAHSGRDEPEGPTGPSGSEERGKGGGGGEEEDVCLLASS